MRTHQPHNPTCMCEACEHTESGDCAVRAYFEGDESARCRLSPAIARILPSLCATDSDADSFPTSSRLDAA